MVVHACPPSHSGAINRRITIQPSPVIMQDPMSKITKSKRVGEMVQVVEHLPGKCKVLSFHPQYHQKKKERKKRGQMNKIEMYEKMYT
jgi:hypothetical protein